jgi:hypothetical protein
MNTRRLGLAFALVVLLAGASSAYADPILHYKVTGSENYTAYFTLAMHPTMLPGGSSSLFLLPAFTAYVNGAPTPVILAFSNLPLVGSGIAGLFSFALGGSSRPLYSWSNNSPTMNVDTFHLVGYGGPGWGSYTLTVSVPEPTSFILLVTGLLALFGIQLLRRHA